MFEKIRRFPRWFAKLPDKKKYIEFVTAILSVPVLLSVIYLNYSNIQNQRKPIEDEPAPTPAIITIIQDRDNGSSNNDRIIPSNTACTPEIGPVEIEFPEEGDNVNTNPLEIIINQNDPQDEYCAVVWSYRINGGTWSSFDDRDISIYNLQPGQKKLEVRVKSVSSGEEETLTRNFNYTNTEAVPTPTEQPTPTTTPSPSPTITVTPTVTEIQ